MVPCSPSCSFSTPVPFFPCSSYSSLKGSRLAAPPQVLQSLYSSVSSWKSFPLSLHGWLFLVLPFLDLLVFPYGRLLGLLSNWLSINYQITTYIFCYFCCYEESAISSIRSRSWIGLWGRDEEFGAGEESSKSSSWDWTWSQNKAYFLWRK